MMVSLLDPISLKAVTNTHLAPFVMEGEGMKAFRIYFENEAHKNLYQSMPSTLTAGLSEKYGPGSH